jgi:hypothetical protein
MDRGIQSVTGMDVMIGAERRIRAGEGAGKEVRGIGEVYRLRAGMIVLRSQTTE